MLKYTEQFMWFITFISVFGTILNVKKRKECFLIWIFSNSAFCIYDFMIKSYAQSFLWFIYVCISVWGIFEWRTKKGEK